ncbi:uncharacterized protein LOC110120006 [Bombus terrestris]|uniref:Uncharacterized protein LOC110120006 n=1 Tax=Bombus terrestris TaxID=30195 RepID=A0A9B7CZK2_BOMTE|nr:uncharacterized protein LOC110120006 [Bombus terrestris]
MNGSNGRTENSSKLSQSFDNRRNYAIETVCLILLGYAIVPCWGSTMLIEKKHETPMHKVELTQKGYIQFLRWELPVPEMTEFTFCLWMQSNDLTHSHPIFSYSKDERERLVRSWIAPHGRSIHLEIGGKQVLAMPTDILENRWYHFCLSWENQAGLYGLWINGQLWAQGHSDETIGQTIPSGGDIVLGQEYTDFDKGLEDGIEGSVLGFNLLLASAFDRPHTDYQLEASYDSTRVSTSSYATVPLFARIPTKLMQRAIDYGMRTKTPYTFLPTNSNKLRGHGYDENAVSLPLLIGTAKSTSSGTTDPWRDATSIELSRLQEQPLGLQLIKLSYTHCEIGRGSPYIGGKLMLISWTRTAVRIFGGALLKNVASDCGNF